MNNFWVDLDKDVKIGILLRAVEYGWLRFEDMAFELGGDCNAF